MYLAILRMNPAIYFEATPLPYTETTIDMGTCDVSAFWRVPVYKTSHQDSEYRGSGDTILYTELVFIMQGAYRSMPPMRRIQILVTSHPIVGSETLKRTLMWLLIRL